MMMAAIAARMVVEEEDIVVVGWSGGRMKMSSKSMTLAKARSSSQSAWNE